MVRVLASFFSDSPGCVPLTSWLHLQASDKILTAPRTTMPEFQVYRRQVSHSITKFLRREKLPFPKVSSALIGQNAITSPIPKPITGKE